MKKMDIKKSAARLMEMRSQPPAQAAAAEPRIIGPVFSSGEPPVFPALVQVTPWTVSIVDVAPPDSRGRIANGGRWHPLRQALRSIEIPPGKAARVTTAMGWTDRHRATAAARAVCKQLGLQATIGARVESGSLVIYVTVAA